VIRNQQATSCSARQSHGLIGMSVETQLGGSQSPLPYDAGLERENQTG
jgi:hypothetical protein